LVYGWLHTPLWSHNTPAIKWFNIWAPEQSLEPVGGFIAHKAFVKFKKNQNSFSKIGLKRARRFQ